MTRDAHEIAIRAAVDALVAALMDATSHSMGDLPDRLYGIGEAAELLAIGRSSLYGEIQAGRVRSIKVGRRRLIPASALRDRIESGTELR